MPVTDIASLDLKLSRESYRYRVPIKFGGRVVTDATVLNVEASCETRAGHRAGSPVGSAAAPKSSDQAASERSPAEGGFGSMPLGVAWAWPDPNVNDDQRLAVVCRLTEQFIADFLADPTGHPLEICHRQSLRRPAIVAAVAREAGLAAPIPELAVLLAASPIEAAIFDAHGKALGQSCFALLGKDYVSEDLSAYLGDDYRGLFLDRFVTAVPKTAMPLYHLVGALDPLSDAEVTSPAADGLPETLEQWIVRDGLTHLKIKLGGDDLDWDVHRVIGVYEAAGRVAADRRFAFSLDFNERCQSEDYVLEFLDRLTSQRAAAVESIEYIEQPTHRDLAAHPENTMHRVAARLPVVIDESLVDLASLRLAVAQGYSGVALKACKGHAEALLMAAVAQHENLYLCVQDLTCIGASLLHSASLAAHIPAVVAIESNGRQYCPAGNAAWVGRYPGMFDVSDGVLPTAGLDGPGLGYSRLAD